MSETIKAGDLGPQHIGSRVRIEFEAIAVEASIEHVAHNYRADSHSVYVALHRGPENRHYSAGVLCPMPALSLGPGDPVVLL